MRPRTVLVCLAGLMVLSLGCAEPSTTTTSTVPQEEPVGIHGAGATFPAPLYKKWIEEYENLFPDRHVSYEAVGSGDGIKRFLSETIDFGASDAAMTDEEIEQAKHGAVLIPATAGSIVVAYNLPGVTGKLKLRRAVYAGIFSGKVTEWNDPRITADNPDLQLPKDNIVVVARQDSSGTTFAFTNHLSEISRAWKFDGPGTGKVVDWPGSAMLARGNEGVAGQIKRSPNTIGYVEYGMAQRTGLATATLENKAGNFIEPSGDAGEATLAAAELPENLRAFFPDPDGDQAYPIVSLTWLLLYRDYPEVTEADDVQHFVNWCLTEGQQYSEELGYVRLPPQITTAALKALQGVQPAE